MRFQLAQVAMLVLISVAFETKSLLADGLADNLVDQVRRIPKLGIEVSQTDRDQLAAGLQSLSSKIETLRSSNSPLAKALIADVLIYHRAVDQALRYQEFFDSKDIAAAKSLLEQGNLRGEQLLAGTAPWTKQTGLIVRGYISKIDQTVQPYGLIIPESYDFTGTRQHRLDFWFHGRGEVLSEVNFIHERSTSVGMISPAHTIVLHPYGRFCNANKLAGEIDSLEALESVKQQYRIDPDRIAVRGFSMGGAACWQFAVHYSDRWFAANPGAGFAETPEFLKTFQKETLDPTPFERKLWQMYDCPGYAVNLAQLPTVAYSGELDIQKQAADIMAKTFEQEGMKLLHLVGPNTGHKIHPDSAREIETKLAEWATNGINRTPSRIQFVTFSLKYNRMHWLTVDRLKEHWTEARIAADTYDDRLVITTKNISALTIDPPKDSPKKVSIDNSSILELSAGNSFVLNGDHWTTGKPTGLRKKHDLQGPIDDAFMDSFIFVKPSGSCRHEATNRWVNSELEHAVTHWRRQMRGDAVVKFDHEITQAEIASSNLVLWGDSRANTITAKIAGQLPIHWTDHEITVGNKSFDSQYHVPVAVYPNPMNPEKYVVLNSSFTYREYDYLNNARQVPKLPDWAIIDIREPTNSRHPGKIVAADFFDEQWRIKPQ